MKTILVNASPKPRFSASSYFLGVQRLLISGTVVTESLHGRGDGHRILGMLADNDTVVFNMPLYVDGVPSHVLHFLKEMEEFCSRNPVRLHIYCVANNGFIEGRQNEPLMQVLRNFCKRSGLDWCGGIGIGGGVMLNITRILFAVNILIFLFQLIQNHVQNGNFLTGEIVGGFLTGTGILIFLNLGVWIHLLRMCRAIHRGSQAFFGVKYVRILLPSVLFAFIASLFFTIHSILSGGFFRGWFSKKEQGK